MNRAAPPISCRALPLFCTALVIVIGSSSVVSHLSLQTAAPLQCCPSVDHVQVIFPGPALGLYSNPTAANLTINGGWGPGAGAVPLTVGFTAWATGGAPPYSYSWNFGDNATTVSNSSGNVTHTYTLIGTFNATLDVTDSLNDSTNETAKVIVEATPMTISSIHASPSATLDLGQTVKLNATITGAGGSYNISWRSLPSGCASQNSTSIACRPNSVGSWPVSICARDPEYVSSCGPWLGVVVSNGPQLSEITYLPEAIDANESLRLSLVVVGWGYGTQVYSWSGLPPGCASIDNTTILCTPTVPGTYHVQALATDSNNGTSTVGTTVVVHPDPMVVEIRASPSKIDVGSSLLLVANITGGLGNYSVEWTGLPTGCLGANESQLYCTPTSPCTCKVSLTATDPSGFVAGGVTALTIQIGGMLDAKTVASSTSLAVGSTVWLNTSVSGGVTPLEYTYVTLPPGCQSANSSVLVCIPNATGTFDVEVEVQDSSGARQFTSTNLTVTSAGTSTSAFSWTSTDGYLLIALAVAIALGVAGFIVHRRRPPPL